MFKHFAAALVAGSLVLAPMQAQANPMVAVGWLWAAGAAGLLTGIVGTIIWQNNRAYVVTPAVAQPINYQQPGCYQARAKYQGRWRNVLICD